MADPLWVLRQLPGFQESQNPDPQSLSNSTSLSDLLSFFGPPQTDEFKNKAQPQDDTIAKLKQAIESSRSLAKDQLPIPGSKNVTGPGSDGVYRVGKGQTYGNAQGSFSKSEHALFNPLPERERMFERIMQEKKRQADLERASARERGIDNILATSLGPIISNDISSLQPGGQSRAPEDIVRSLRAALLESNPSAQNGPTGAVSANKTDTPGSTPTTTISSTENGPTGEGMGMGDLAKYGIPAALAAYLFRGKLKGKGAGVAKAVEGAVATEVPKMKPGVVDLATIRKFLGGNGGQQQMEGAYNFPAKEKLGKGMQGLSAEMKVIEQILRGNPNLAGKLGPGRY